MRRKPRKSYPLHRLLLRLYEVVSVRALFFDNGKSRFMRKFSCETYMKKENAVKITRGVGGRAFPSDYNWTCRNGHECRSFETSCYSCEMDAEQAKMIVK